MTPIQVMAAYKAMHELAKCVLPYKITRKVHTLKKQLNSEFDTILSAEIAMVEKYEGICKNGTYSFETSEQSNMFHNEYNKYMNQEDDDIKLSKVDLSSCLDAIKISSSAIEALEGLVYFGDD